MNDNKTPVSISPGVKFAVDKFLPTKIAGWARYQDEGRPVLLELIVNGHVVGSFRADAFRQDLKKMRPDGRFAFSLSPFNQNGWEGKVPQDALVQIRIKGSDIVIGSTVWNGLAPAGQKGIIDSNGYNLQLNKGRFVIPLSERSHEWKTELISKASKIASEAKAEGFKVCASYGTLLGAVREGALIGHDDDVDLMFISNETTMLRAVDEFHRFQSFLISKKYNVRELSNGQVHTHINGDFPVDIFLAWFENNDLSLTFTVRSSVPQDEIIPFGTVELLGQSLPIPRKPESLLEAIYGPTWKIPDPAFVWVRPKDIADYFAPMHNYKRGANAEYWIEFYSKRSDVSPPELPTQFALFALTARTVPSQIIDLGCGNGRDTLFFGAQGIKTVGLDYAQTAIDANEASARMRGLTDNVSFRQIDVSNLGQIKEAIELIDEFRTPSPLCIYSRFFFHALDENAEGSALMLVSELLKMPDDYAVFEFRTANDANRSKVTPAHYRRYINVDDFLNKAKNLYNLSCQYRVEGTGYAVFKDDDAYVTRLILAHS